MNIRDQRVVAHPMIEVRIRNGEMDFVVGDRIDATVPALIALDFRHNVPVGMVGWALFLESVRVARPLSPVE